jgi:hypothetical protein
MKATRILDNSSFVATNFILRGSYSGSPHTIRIDPKQGREEYVDTMLNSDFPLVMKGDGNYSYRFYEALSLGRVPVFINTDCVLPLADRLNYDEFVLSVNHKDICHLDTIIRDFYDSLDEESFVAMQKKAREVFEKYLSTNSFLRYAVDNLLG